MLAQAARPYIRQLVKFQDVSISALHSRTASKSSDSAMAGIGWTKAGSGPCDCHGAFLMYITKKYIFFTTTDIKENMVKPVLKHPQLPRARNRFYFKTHNEIMEFDLFLGIL